MYSTGQMTERTGATGRQLGTWASKGWLTSPAPGTGHGREWSEADLQTATLMMRFIRAGFSVDRAWAFTRVIQERDTTKEGARIRIGEDMWVIVKGL